MKPVTILAEIVRAESRLTKGGQVLPFIVEKGLIIGLFRIWLARHA
jgi:hypothetical protein